MINFSFIDHSTPFKLQLPLITLKDPLLICTINGSPNWVGNDLTLLSPCQVTCTSAIYTISLSPCLPLIHPRTHHIMNLVAARPIPLHLMGLLEDHSIVRTLQSALQHPHLSISFTFIKSNIQVHNPEEYHAFNVVFSKTKANGLLPHHSCDGATNLRPDTILPCSQIYSPHGYSHVYKRFIQI